jgi:hypothetical protein
MKSATTYISSTIPFWRACLRIFDVEFLTFFSSFESGAISGMQPTIIEGSGKFRSIEDSLIA